MASKGSSCERINGFAEMDGLPIECCRMSAYLFSI